jgi:hypothetical protein
MSRARVNTPRQLVFHDSNWLPRHLLYVLCRYICYHISSVWVNSLIVSALRLRQRDVTLKFLCDGIFPSLQNSPIPRKKPVSCGRCSLIMGNDPLSPFHHHHSVFIIMLLFHTMSVQASLLLPFTISVPCHSSS